MYKTPNNELSPKSDLLNNKDVGHNVDSVEDACQDINKKIAEMDKELFGFAKITKIKDQLPATPTNQEYLLKQVNKLYYGDFSRFKQLQQEKAGTAELEPKDKLFYRIPFPASGYKGLAYLELERSKSFKTWCTAEFGKGYTTTAEEEPDFLELQVKYDKERQEKHGYFMHAISNGSGTVMGMQCNVEKIIRSHENSEYCYSFSFQFDTREQADEFSKKISEIKFKPEDLMSFMWNGTDFLFENLSFLGIEKEITFMQGKALNKELHKKIPALSSARCRAEKKNWEQEVSKYQQKVKWEDILEILKVILTKRSKNI